MRSRLVQKDQRGVTVQGRFSVGIWGSEVACCEADIDIRLPCSNLVSHHTTLGSAWERDIGCVLAMRPPASHVDTHPLPDTSPCGPCNGSSISLTRLQAPRWIVRRTYGNIRSRYSSLVRSTQRLQDHEASLQTLCDAC